MTTASYHAHGCEGSHAAFAPVGPLQMGLLAYMNGQGFDHVSFERVCSGGLGIPNLYAYLKTTGLTEPAWLADELARRTIPPPSSSRRRATPTGPANSPGRPSTCSSPSWEQRPVT